MTQSAPQDSRAAAEAQDEWQELIEAKQALLLLAEGGERTRLLLELGDLHSARNDGAAEAIRCYEEVRAERGDEPALLHKLRGQYARAGRWPDVVDVLGRCAAQERDPEVRGKLHETAAVILRDTLAQPAEALAAFERALDAYFADPARVTKERLPELLGPLSAIDQMQAARRDWDGLAQSYRRMLARMPEGGHGRARLTLWHALGEIHRVHRGDAAQAIAAYEEAQRIEADAGRQEVLEALYVAAGGEQAERAVEGQRRAVARDPLQPEPYRNLLRAWLPAGRPEAFQALAALVALGKATEEEQRRYEERRPRGGVVPRGRLGEAEWALLYHEHQDRVQSSLLGAIAPAVGLLRAAEHGRLGLRRKERRDLLADETLLGRLLLGASQALGVAPPEAYFLPERSEGLLLANAREGQQLLPSVVAGAGALSGRSDRELAFLAGVFVSRLRPEHYLRLVQETAVEREVALRAALRLCGLQFAVPPEQRAVVEQYAQALRPYLRPAVLEHLQQVVLRVGEARISFDTTRWAHAVDLTAQRAGLLLCGDPVVAARLVAQEPTVPGLGPRERVGDLLRFAVSPAYQQLRQALGAG